MKVLIMGATGATGHRAVGELLARDIDVVAVVRSRRRLLQKLGTEAEPSGLTIVEGNVLDMESSMLESLLKDCDAGLSFLGHNLTWKGIFGGPRYLVRDSVRRVCETAAERTGSAPFRMVLMNTTGNRNPHEDDRRRPGEAIVTALIRGILPPHRDNERAASWLSNQYGSRRKEGVDSMEMPSEPGAADSRNRVSWAAVRPDNLTEDEPGPYFTVASPNRSPIFNAGKTSRANVAAFMADLAGGGDAWNEWKFRMPVVYNENQ